MSMSLGDSVDGEVELPPDIFRLIHETDEAPDEESAKAAFWVRYRRFREGYNHAVELINHPEKLWNLYDLNLSEEGGAFSLWDELTQFVEENADDYSIYGRIMYEAGIIRIVNKWVYFCNYSNYVIVREKPDADQFCGWVGVKMAKDVFLKSFQSLRFNVLDRRSLGNMFMYHQQLTGAETNNVGAVSCGIVSKRGKKIRFLDLAMEQESSRTSLTHILNDNKLFQKYLNRCQDCTFDPKSAEMGLPYNGYFNLYGGLYLSRKRINDMDEEIFRNPIGVEAFFSYIRFCWCVNDEEALYVILWLAELMQKPWVAPGKSILVSGPPGTGKTTLFEYVCRMIGYHSKHVQSLRDFVGRFADLSEKVFVFPDDVDGNMDLEQAGILKHIITSTTLRTERKYMPVQSQRNCLSLAMATNFTEKIPAESNRRTFVLHCDSEAYIQLMADGDKETFWSRFNESVSAALPSIAAILLNIDLNGFDHRAGSSRMDHVVAFDHLLDEDIHLKWWCTCLVERRVLRFRTNMYGNSEPAGAEWSDRENFSDVLGCFDFFAKITKGSSKKKRDFKEYCTHQLGFQQDNSGHQLVLVWGDFDAVLARAKKDYPNFDAWYTYNKGGLKRGAEEISALMHAGDIFPKGLRLSGTGDFPELWKRLNKISDEQRRFDVKARIIQDCRQSTEEYRYVISPSEIATFDPQDYSRKRTREQAEEGYESSEMDEDSSQEF